MPNRNKGGYKPRAQATPPTRFRCKVGGEWKPLSEFSNNQQKHVKWQLENHENVDPAHSGMICKEHSAGNKLEYRCEVCDLIKPRDHFSKAALRREEIICERCTAWTETQEPGVTPSPLETGHVSVEEENEGVWVRDFANADFFGDTNLPRAPVTGLSGLGLTELESTADGTRANRILSEVLTRDGSTSSQSLVGGGDTSSVADEAMSTITRLPPHLAGKVSTKANSVVSSVATSNLKQHTELPPHLRGAGSISTASTVRKDREEATKARQVQYNAWDPTGKKHQAIKNPTVMSSSGASAMSSADKSEYSSNPNLIGDWSDVSGALDTEPVTRGGSSKWPKSSELRIPQSEIKKQPALVPTKAKNLDPEADRQRRMHYCESDDSDF